jgi:xylan 1,4-beta-xylosidase
VGYRTLATNGIDKPVLNAFRIFGLMSGERLATESAGALTLDSVITSGVRNRQEINAIATRDAHRICVLVWNYSDDSAPGASRPIQLNVEGIPASPGRVRLEHYRIDEDHSNSFTAWKAMGSPQQPDPEQYSRLESAAQLELFDSPRWLTTLGGRLELTFSLPAQAVSLLVLTW